MAEPGARWTVHIIFTDGSTEEVLGDPEVDEGVLRVQHVNADFPHNILFEAGYPLLHVKWWWVDYAHDENADAARSGPANSEDQFRPPPKPLSQTPPEPLR